MTVSHRITLQLRCPIDVDPTDRPPVEGDLELSDGTVRTFRGWLGLVNELERVVTETAAR